MEDREERADEDWGIDRKILLDFITSYCLGWKDGALMQLLTRGADDLSI